MTTPEPPPGPACTTHAGAVLLPAAPDPTSRLGVALGAYDAAGGFLEACALRRNYGESGRLPLARGAERLEARWLYGGLWTVHFGHFLLETLARAAALRAAPDLPVLWHSALPLPGGQLPVLAWQGEILRLLGLDPARFRAVLAPVTVETLDVPEAGYVMQFHAHPAHVAAMGVVPFAAPRPGRRVWLSRAALPGQQFGGVEGEPAAEAILAADGWEILIPESLPIAGLLAHLADAEAIAGFAGSAFHALLLARDVRAKLRIVSRPPERIPYDYRTIAPAKGIDLVAAQVDLEHLSGAGHRARYRLREPGQVVQFLRDTLP